MMRKSFLFLCMACLVLVSTEPMDGGNLEHVGQLGTSAAATVVQDKRKLWPAWMIMTTAHVPMNCTWAEFPVCCALLDNSPSNYYPRVENLPTFHHFAHTNHHSGGAIGTHGEHNSANIKSSSTIRHTNDQHLRRLESSHNSTTSIHTGSSGTKTTSSGGGSDSIIFYNTEKLHTKCHTERHYVPSQYETEHIKKALEVAQNPNIEQRRHDLIDFIEKDIDNTNKWLHRVDFHMRDQRSAHEKYITPHHPDDLQYMSRFNITMTCSGVSHHWIEWIEPLSIHTRHPNGLIEHCNYFLPTEIRNSPKIEFHAAGITSPDYVLVQHNDDYHHRKILGKKLSPIRRKYFFDAGANYFNTATAWFTCAYLQKGIDFDHIYAIEYDKLDPIKYFNVAPPKIIPFVHFMNIPASHNLSESGSILRMIKQLTRDQDFVAWKLDIDCPEIEIPMFLDLLNSDEYSGLIDEFFFELHFRCEFMMQCGWQDKMPEEYMGMKLERSVVMQSFQKLRYKGIRAHFWP